MKLAFPIAMLVAAADSDSSRYEARLRAVFQPRLRGRPALGTLVHRGRTYRVRCVES